MADIMADVPRMTVSDGSHVELPEGEPVGSALPAEALPAAACWISSTVRWLVRS